MRVPSPRPDLSTWRPGASCAARRARLSHLEAWISQMEAENARPATHPRPRPLAVMSVRYEIQDLRAWFVRQADADDAEAVDNVTLADEETAVPVLRVHAPTPEPEPSASRPICKGVQPPSAYAAALPKPPNIVRRVLQPKLRVTSGPLCASPSSSIKRKTLDTVDAVDAEAAPRSPKRVRQ